jgi:recombination protein RecT
MENTKPANTGNTSLTKSQKLEVSNAISNNTIADTILNSMDKLVKQDALVIPKGYNMGNNLKLAYLSIIQNSNLTGATNASIGETLVEMVLQALDITKKQCYFVKFGNKCTLMRSYFGDVAVLERTGLVQVNTTKAVVVYDGDTLEVAVEDDDEVLKSFKANPNVFERHNKKIIGAYAVTTLSNGKKKYVFMSKEEIDKSWSKSKDPSRNVQKDFPQEMAKRTVIRRLTKYIFNFSANDVDLNAEQRQVIDSYNRSTNNEYIDISKSEDSNTRSNTSIPQALADINATPDVANDFEEKAEEPIKEEIKEPINEPTDEEPAFDDDIEDGAFDEDGNMKLA